MVNKISSEKVIFPYDVLVLVGGKGERVSQLYPHIPKPLIPINGVPFIELLVRYLIGQGAKRIILLLGYKGEMIKQHFINLNISDWDIEFSFERKFLGTAGAVKKALNLIKSQNVLVLNGDSLFLINYLEFIKFHLENSSLLTIAGTAADGESRYGIIRFNDNNHILSFNEKGSRSQKSYINAGVYLLNRDVIEGMPSKIPLSIEYDVFPNLLNLPMFLYKSTANFIDIGTPQSLNLAAAKIQEWMNGGLLF